MSIGIQIILVVVGTGVLLAWLYRDKLGRQKAPPTTDISPPIKRTSVHAKLVAELPRWTKVNRFPILNFEQLIEVCGVSGLLKEIENKTGFTKTNFTDDCLPVLSHVAEYIQLLPASEAHHHAHPGGLITHLFEVVRHSLHLRTGVALPIGASPEEQMRLGPIWTYGVFLGALLHDIGKPVSDVIVTLHDQRERTTVWHPMTASMTDTTGKTYSVEFNAERQYREHEGLAINLLRALVPTTTLQWLAKDPNLYKQLVEVLSGNPAKENILYRIINKGDSHSVEASLAKGPATRFSSARAIPLIDRITRAITRMLDEGGHLPLNRPGGSGFVYGEDVWFIAGTLGDKVRQYLNTHEIRTAAAAGIPTDNSRIFDILSEYQSIQTQVDGSAIWSIRVTVGDWSQNLTALRFRRDKIDTQVPDSPVVSIEVLAKKLASAKPDSFADTLLAGATATPAPIKNETSENQGHPMDNPEEAEPQRYSEIAEAPERDPNTINIHFDTEEPLLPAVLPTVVNEKTIPAEIQTQRPEPPADTPIAPVKIAAKSNQAGRRTPNPGKNSPPHIGVERFFAWIQQGLQSGEIHYNESSAFVHFTEAGMLLLSPACVKEFVGKFGIDGDGSNPSDDRKQWAKFQSLLQRSGYLKRRENCAISSYLHTYSTSKGDLSKPLRCYLVPSPERFFANVPAPNPHLFAVNDPTEEQMNSLM